YTINSNAATILASVKDLTNIKFQGVHFTTSGAGSTCVQATGGARCDLDTIVFGSFDQIDLSYGTEASGSLTGSCRLDSSPATFPSANTTSYLALSMALNLPTPLGFTIFAAGQAGGVLDNSLASYSGAGSGTGSGGQRWASNTAGGVIATGNTFPGTVAGVA